MTKHNNISSNANSDHVWIWLSSLALTFVITYLANSFLLDTRIMGFEIGLFSIVAIGFFCFTLAAISFSYLWKQQRITNSGLQNIVFSSLISLIALVTLDSVFSAYIRSTTPDAVADTRLFDKNTRIMELYPRLYYPTDRNFRLHKPGTAVSGSHYGGFYQKKMLESPTLVKDVLSRRSIAINIDQHGFREDAAIESAHIFAIGDSYTFGWGVNQEELWVNLVEGNLGQTVFNLGMHDSSPKQELELLRYVLQNLAGRVDHVLWLIYEGNDLEDSYAEKAPSKTVNTRESGLRQVISNLFRGLKDNSVIHQFRAGRARLAMGKSNTAYIGSHEIEGVSLATPVFFSETLGLSFFHPEHIKRGSQPESYVLEHPNRPLLDKTFEDMSKLASDNKFDVTVIILPTNVRLHGQYFDGIPELSTDPHFINYVENLSRRLGFTVVNLYGQFQPYVKNKLLHFRDDAHWNAEGHRMAAKAILQEIFDIENPSFE